MKVMILGGDGFCGWPTALHLSARGHEVSIVDDGSRRMCDRFLGCQSLTPIAELEQRIAAWREVSGHHITHWDLDLAQKGDEFAEILQHMQPDAVVHFAEQRSAPFSMKSYGHKRYTVDRNVNATHNILGALVESGSRAHLVHLGTMGVYGYDGELVVPEGYLSVRATGRLGNEVERSIVFPPAPGSVYHLTKVLDHQMFQFYSRNDGLAITDLHQGIVWGTQTDETAADPRLINRFDYDGDYGTVLNRFAMQAAVGYPLTVHGTGGQCRAFINIRDTVRCVELAIANPPAAGAGVRVFNQMTECFTVRELAELVARLTGATIDHQVNPRREAEANVLQVDNSSFRGLGLKGVLLETGLVEDTIAIARTYASRAAAGHIKCTSYWNRERAAAAAKEQQP